MFSEGGGLAAAAVVYGVALAFRGGFRRTVTVEGHGGIGLNSSILLPSLWRKNGAFFFQFQFQFSNLILSLSFPKKEINIELFLIKAHGYLIMGFCN